jgi:[2-(trimethylamino)ethyl]phosphonate dioxygenase
MLETTMRASTIANVDNRGDRLTVRWQDGEAGLFHAIWLRDNSPAPDARDPRNGQKLFNITDLAPDTRIADAVVAGHGVDMTFAPDGHRATFDGDWLRAHRSGAPKATPKLWGAELKADLPRASYGDVAGHNTARARWLGHIRDRGVALLTGVAPEPGMVCRVVDLFGFVRETNYGRLFDVRAEPQPTNLAYTGLGLSCHTDNPYRDPVPGLQLLHCLVAENDGGESIVVDGFKAAALLRDEAPEDFALLTRHAVPFRFQSADTVLEARAPLIGLDDRGRVAEIRFNNRSIGCIDLEPDVMPDFYRAYRRFAEVLQRPALEVGFKLGPGDLFIVDNRRVLHGRKTVGGSGRRHLQGCYADMDSLLSTLRLLEAA